MLLKSLAFELLNQFQNFINASCSFTFVLNVSLTKSVN